MNTHRDVAKVVWLSVGFLLSVVNAITAETLHYPLMAGPYYRDTVYDGNGSVKMLSSDSHVCVLTKVGGHFAGDRERVAVRVSNDGYWYLEATGIQHIWGSAYCFSRTLFTGQDKWLSDEYTASAEFDCSWWFLCNRVLPEENWIVLWWGDAVSFINGIGGNFEYDVDEDVVKVWQAVRDSFRSSSLWVSTHASYIWGLAYSYFVGVAHSGHKAKFVDPQGNRFSDANSYAWYAAGAGGSKGDYSIRTMAPVDKGMCYFYEIDGDLIGNNFVSIEKEFRGGVEHWILKGYVSDGYLSAQANCFAFDQQ